MKNIKCYYVNALMMDSNWIASPFVLNYGYRPIDYGYTDVDDGGRYVGYDDYWMEWDYESQAYLNIFGTEKPDYELYVDSCKKKSTWKHSFKCGDMAYAKYGSPTKVYNTIQLLFQPNGILKMAAIWLDDCNKFAPIKVDDYSFIGYVKFEKDSFRKFTNGLTFPKLITYDCMLFKYTMNLYDDNLRLRFDDNFDNDEVQYTGKTRFDNGYVSLFSVLPNAIHINDRLASRCVDVISRLRKLSMYDDVVKED